jgi:uncharacterized protein YegP (UPF0339 family)
MSAKFEITRSDNGQYHFHLKAGNGEIILTSEMYAAKSGAETGIHSVKANAAHDDRYERKTARNGGPFFVLTAANREVIGTSQMYSSPSAMEKGIESVKHSAPVAEISDLTEKAHSQRSKP